VKIISLKTNHLKTAFLFHLFFSFLLKLLAMPFYRITIWQINQKPVAGIRHSNITNPDLALNFFWQLALTKMSRHHISKFEVVMLPKTSSEVRKYIKRLEEKKAK
jgi:hypothetical protein